MMASSTNLSTNSLHFYVFEPEPIASPARYAVIELINAVFIPDKIGPYELSLAYQLPVRKWLFSC